MTDAQMSISEQMLLEKCREIELLCKEMYGYFSELFAEPVAISQLWNKTAIEEQNHADQFTLALKLRKSLPCTISVDAQKINSIITQLQELIIRVKQYPPTLEDALTSSIKLERYLSEFHLSCVVTFGDESYRNLFNAMMASDQEHVASLQESLDQLSGVQIWTFAG